MVRVHSTRLMPVGEVALWHNGRIVWQGSVGAAICDIIFDAISMHVEDAARITGIGQKAVTREMVVSALANWWGTGF